MCLDPVIVHQQIGHALNQLELTRLHLANGADRRGLSMRLNLEFGSKT